MSVEITEIVRHNSKYYEKSALGIFLMMRNERFNSQHLLNIINDSYLHVNKPRPMNNLMCLHLY